MRLSLFAVASSLSLAFAQFKGFNYGSTAPSGAPYTQQDFERLFTNAANLPGTSGFTSARLFTMIQAGSTTNQPISAIPAAINTKTSLLLGLWASAGDAGFASELAALRSAIQTYPQFASQIAGISVGSEDLYRISPEAQQQGSTDPGAQPATLVNYIQQVRDVLAGTAWSGAKVGHVDTWTVWANSALGDPVASAVDFVGVDAYAYWEQVAAGGNDISSGARLFQSALSSLTPTANSKEIWITETGWPTTGSTNGLAVPSPANAARFWQDVGCNLLFGKVNVWWFQFFDTGLSPSFGVSDGTNPLFNLACSASSSSSSASSTTAATSTSSANVATTTPAATSVASTSSAVSTSTATTTPTTSSSASSAVISSSKPSDGAVTTVVWETHYATVTSCPPGQSTLLTKTVTATSASTIVTSASTPTSTSKSCPADLKGIYEYPHLIVPVSSKEPNTAYGTKYNGTISPTVSTIFNFDIPASYAGKTCSLVFLFPLQSQLETSAYSFNGQGGLSSSLLSGVATEATTFANTPSVAVKNGEIPSLKSGNSYTISSDACPAGQRVSFKVESTGGLALDYFQDYNPSPLGLYVRVC